MTKAWIDVLDDERTAFVHAVSGEDLDTLATYCREAGDTHRTGGDMKHVARVDGAVIIDWCNKRGITFGAFMRDEALITQFLNDPQNDPFRIWKGRV
ncbi:hypothetical protein [Lysobacter panacisoli]|uniref:Uncharacterized protein n=1 Tax=Lysobacter panacisoli TaxID=1255263 RepID=A0ABP9LC52_9GAMM|nr:hypothetical protein [Lysobacter panacisoli]